MGIKFKCPQGHKIHVKAFLAGKRAICPHCGEKVIVPLASANDLAGAVAAAAAAPTLAQSDAPDDTDSLPRWASEAASPIQTGPVPGAIADVPTDALVPTAMHTSVTADPIAESPLAVWYVRPRAGGQFGPAPGEMFRRWLAEGRVGADARVWREGWADWKVAVSVFSSLAVPASAVPAAMPATAAVASRAMPPNLPTAGIAPAFGPAASPAFTPITPASTGMTGGDGMDLPPLPRRTAAAYTAPGRHGSKTTTLVVIILLAVVAISLIGVLAYVIGRG
ncbi:MAG: DUF4339 domain-containing protein [Pirellulales bacterium]